jgi:hypothetical protein
MQKVELPFLRNSKYETYLCLFPNAADQTMKKDQ